MKTIELQTLVLNYGNILLFRPLVIEQYIHTSGLYKSVVLEFWVIQLFSNTQTNIL